MLRNGKKNDKRKDSEVSEDMFDEVKFSYCFNVFIEIKYIFGRNRFIELNYRLKSSCL